MVHTFWLKRDWVYPSMALFAQNHLTDMFSSSMASNTHTSMYVRGK